MLLPSLLVPYHLQRVIDPKSIDYQNLILSYHPYTPEVTQLMYYTIKQDLVNNFTACLLGLEKLWLGGIRVRYDNI